jgi:predicted ATPase/DNA-binding CsgD family transcriptional regulator/class 3 adenylate cyclase
MFPAPGDAMQPAGGRRSILPAGTVTFLLADGSAAGLAALREAVVAHGGTPAAAPPGAVPPGVDTPPTGDTPPAATPPGPGAGLVAARLAAVPAARPAPGRLVAVFGSTADAVAAALALRSTDAGAGTGDGRLGQGVRIGVHAGEALLRDEAEYVGPALDRAARLRDVANPGQVLLSAVTAAAVGDALPADAVLVDLGTHRLRDLSRPEHVFELRRAGEDADGSPRLRSLDALATNLPVQLTSFVGRGDELAEVEVLLDGERLVTLTGSGGCGKTRLAMQAVAEVADRWPDGVWWVDLAPVSDPHLVAELAATATGALVEPIGGPLRALTLQLRDRRLLVCLDNCEHLLDAAAEVAEALLVSCPEVSVLTTSREPLGVPGETVWRVPSLVEAEAVSLFTERASRVRPFFTLDATNEAPVRTLCRRLDGIPLAIELAAAWLRTLTAAQVASGLDDRFALLVRGPRGAVERHQTLAASIAWSHDLLAPSDRVVFRRLAAFAGGFGLDAARAVCSGEGVAAGEVLPALARLVDKSLVVMDEHGGEARYRLLETIRQFAADRLAEAGESDAARDRHLDHYLAFAETASPLMVSAEADLWLARGEQEHDDLRAALDWALSRPRTGPGGPDGAGGDDPERGRRLAAALFWLWYLHGHAHEGIEYLERAIELGPDERTTTQATLLAGIAATAIGSKHFGLIVDYAQRGLEVATAIGDRRNEGRCLLLLATIQHYIDFDAAQRMLDAARAAAEASDDAFVADRVVVMEGSLWSSRDRQDKALPLLEEGLARCLARADRGFAALALDYMVDAAVRRGDLAEAERLAAWALDVAGPLGDYFSVGLATSHLAFVRGLSGDIEGGLGLMERVIRAMEGADHEVFVPRMATVRGALHLWSGDAEAAAASARRDVLDAGPMAASRVVARALPWLAAALRRLGRTEEAAAHVERGITLARGLGVPHLVAESLDEAGRLALAAGEPARAEDLFHEALAIRAEHAIRLPMVDSLEALAEVAAVSESPSEAARLLGAAEAARATFGRPRPPGDVAGHEALLARLRAVLGEGAGGEAAGPFAKAWDEGRGMALDEAVALVRRARGSRGRPTRGWASLTPTERDVVRAVVDGLTNPEIGARLFMSRGTVKTHLSHVYAKLDVANRTELATVAAQHTTG